MTVGPIQHGGDRETGRRVHIAIFLWYQLFTANTTQGHCNIFHPILAYFDKKGQMRDRLGDTNCPLICPLKII